MKFAVMLTYGDTPEGTVDPQAHHEYLYAGLQAGHVVAAGPMEDDLGALWVCEFGSIDEVTEFVSGDPYCTAGRIKEYQIRPLAYWSAKAYKGG